jgi:hypothetical protein
MNTVSEYGAADGLNHMFKTDDDVFDQFRQ